MGLLEVKLVLLKVPLDDDNHFYESRNLIDIHLMITLVYWLPRDQQMKQDLKPNILVSLRKRGFHSKRGLDLDLANVRSRLHLSIS